MGDVNTYQIFAGLVRQIVGGAGRVGVIVPSGIATDYYTQDYFNALVDNRELVSLFDFENRDGIFHGVHRSYKFCLLTLTGAGAPARAIDFAFFLTQPEQLSEEDRHFTLTRDDLYSINPNTGTCPTFRSKRDAELTKTLYDAAPVLIDEAEDENPWGVSFSTMFHMSGDSDLFHTREELEADGFVLQGNRFARGEEVYLPMHEGRLGHQFNHRFAIQPGGDLREVELSELTEPTFLPEPQYFVRAEKAYERLESRDPQCKTGMLGHRRVSRNTDERTSIASILPYGAASYGWILSLGPDAMGLSCLASAYNSFVFDYLLRNQLSQPSIPQSTFAQLAMPAPERYTPELLEYIVPRVLELTYTAWDLAAFADDVWSESDAALQSAIEAQWQANAQATGGGHRGKTPPAWVEHSEQAEAPFPHPPFLWDEERRAHLRAELDGLYGHLYGLTRDELAYILDTFPIVKRKDEEAHGTYRTKRLVLEAYDALAGKEMLEAPEEALKE